MDLWTTGDLTPPDDATQAEMRQLHDEIVAIRALGDEDACRICGSRDLSEEHTPSRRAGNIHRVYRGGLDDTETLARGELRFDLELLQGGVTVETICTKCNNDSGRRYNPAYVRLVNVSGPFATFENIGKTCEVAVTAHPQRIAKQALTTILATSDAGITERFPHVRKLLMNAEHRESLSPLRLGLFLRANGQTRGALARSTGLQGSVRHGVGRIMAEFSFWPLGWVPTFDDIVAQGRLDVSSWTVEYGFHDKADLRIAVPCQWAHWIYAGTFGPSPAVLHRHYIEARDRVRSRT